MRVYSLIWNKVLASKEAIAWASAQYDQEPEDTSNQPDTVEWETLNEAEKLLFSRVCCIRSL